MKVCDQSTQARSTLNTARNIQHRGTVQRGSSEYHGVILRLIERLSALNFKTLDQDGYLLCAEQWFLVYLESPEHADLRSTLEPCECGESTADSVVLPEEPLGFVVMELLCWLCLQGINPFKIQLSNFVEFLLVWYPDNEDFAPLNMVQDTWQLKAFMDFLHRIGAPSADACRGFISERSKARILAISMAAEVGESVSESLPMAC